MAGHDQRSLLTVQLQPEKAIAYDRLSPFAFDDQLNCWCVFDGELISAIFQSDTFQVVPYAQYYREIAERTSIDLDAIITALDFIPLANEGADHKRLRGEFAAVTAGQGRSVVEAMEEYVASLMRNVFVAGTDVDLSAFVQRIYHQLFSLWLGTRQDDVVGTSDFSQVFDRTRSLNRRKSLNRNLAELTCSFAKKRDKLSTSPEIAVAMNVVGRDAFVGSIVLSFRETLARSPGARLCDIAFSQTLPSTAVPYVERLAMKDAEIGGMRVRKGQRIRLFLDATAQHVSGEDANLLFGKGRHICLGKPITLVIWRAMVAAASTISVRCTVGEFKMREGDYVFSYPERAIVRLHG